MKVDATERAKMPAGTSKVLDSRSLQNSYSTLLPVLKKGMRVLDVGCGTGAISAGIAEAVGDEGYVIGIDSSDHLIAKGKQDYADVTNLELVEANLFEYNPSEKFDLIVSARVLQWLSNPGQALAKFKTLLKPGGQISILDYNHTKLEWKPEPPASMKKFYQAFLDWRADAGMDNEIADHLPLLFEQQGFHSIETINADEVAENGEESFADRLSLWSKVAELRGPQVVKSGFISEAERLQAIDEYDTWTVEHAEAMIVKLKDVRGKLPL